MPPLYQTVIVDDEKAQQKLLSDMLAGFPSYHVQEVCATLEEAKEAIGRVKPDLVFLDVNIPPYTGFDLLDQLEGINFDVIFCTALEQFAIRAFKVSAIDYLLKPFGEDELRQALDKFEKRAALNGLPARHLMNMLNNMTQANAEMHQVALPTATGYEFVKSSDVLYCDSVRSYTNFFLLDGKQLMVSKGAKDCEELLTDFKFIRINQSQIINPKYIKSYTRGRGGDLTLINGITLEVSRDKKKDLLDHFRKL